MAGHPLRWRAGGEVEQGAEGSVLHIEGVFETDPLGKVAPADTSPNPVSRRAGSLPPGGRQACGSCTWWEDAGRSPARRCGSLWYQRACETCLCEREPSAQRRRTPGRILHFAARREDAESGVGVRPGGWGFLGLPSGFFVPTTLRCGLLSLSGGSMPGDPNQGEPVIPSPPTQAERGASSI